MLKNTCAASPTNLSIMPPCARPMRVTPFEIAVERGDQRFRLGAADHAGETLDVGEQRGDFAPLAAELRLIARWRRCARSPAARDGARSAAASTRARRRADAPITAAAAAKPASAGATISDGSNEPCGAGRPQTAAGNGAASAIAAAA